jgi:hypothetical protein
VAIRAAASAWQALLPDTRHAISYARGDATNLEWYDSLLGADAPDVIVDDGSHQPADVRATFELLWPKLADGGLYFVEDLHNVGFGTHQAVRYFQGLVPWTHVHRDAKVLTGWTLRDAILESGRDHLALSTIESITFHRDVVILRKRDRTESLQRIEAALNGFEAEEMHFSWRDCCDLVSHRSPLFVQRLGDIGGRLAHLAAGAALCCLGPLVARVYASRGRPSQMAANTQRGTAELV